MIGALDRNLNLVHYISPICFHTMSPNLLPNLAVVFCVAAVQGFAPLSCLKRRCEVVLSSQHFAGVGGDDGESAFSYNSNKPQKTYGSDVAPSRDVIDLESAMKDFFSAREEWIPLFRTLITDKSCAAIDFLQPWDDEIIEFNDATTPWRQLWPIPQDEEDRTALARFLDEVQKSLIDIPVNEKTQEDDNDVQFIEEGRRLLTLNRFHVLRDNCGRTVESNDDLFSICWSELLYLSSEAKEHSGSLILLPKYDLADLRRFTDMNVVQPLEWLGIQADFEVASLKLGSSAIRLIYKLSDIPSSPME